MLSDTLWEALDGVRKDRLTINEAQELIRDGIQWYGSDTTMETYATFNWDLLKIYNDSWNRPMLETIQYNLDNPQPPYWSDPEFWELRNDRGGWTDTDWEPADDLPEGGMTFDVPTGFSSSDEEISEGVPPVQMPIPEDTPH